jgi:hypothetical protein
MRCQLLAEIFSFFLLSLQELAKEMMGLKVKGGIDGMMPETKEQFDDLVPMFKNFFTAVSYDFL